MVGHIHNRLQQKHVPCLVCGHRGIDRRVSCPQSSRLSPPAAPVRQRLEGPWTLDLTPFTPSSQLSLSDCSSDTTPRISPCSVGDCHPAVWIWIPRLAAHQQEGCGSNVRFAPAGHVPARAARTSSGGTAQRALGPTRTPNFPTRRLVTPTHKEHPPRMYSRITRSGLRIDERLDHLVRDEIAPGTGIDPDAFWTSLAAIVRDLAPLNRTLLEQRNDLQQPNRSVVQQGLPGR